MASQICSDLGHEMAEELREGGHATTDDADGDFGEAETDIRKLKLYDGRSIE